MPSNDKGINLMPEDLRSKEQEILAKQDENFEPDLVVPGQQNRADFGKPTGSQESFWSKLGKMFRSKPKAPKAKKEKTKKSNGSILVKEMKKKDNKKMDSIKAPDLHKPEKSNGSILVKEMKKNGHAKDPEPLPKKEEPKLEERKPEPKKESNFVIPEEPKVSVMKAPEPETPKPEEPKKEDKKKKDKKKKQDKKDEAPKGFHQPELRIKPKVLSDGGGVDLIPTSVKIRSWKQISNLILLSLVGSLVILGISYGSLFIQERNIKNKQDNRDRQISDLEVQILKFETFNKTVEVLGKDIKMTHKAINEHIYWTNFFNLLEKYTVSDVYYAGFAAGNDGALTLSAVGGSYDSVAKQLKLLQQPEASEFVEAVSITGAQKGGEGVTFSVVLVLNKDLFYYQPDLVNNIEDDDNDDGDDDQDQRN
ncbi:hypothetical protein C0580_01590 [Candidatus Parcubacteria bacterium]|nr:MAG: hypothetical protein C0580_01590 [Candidatus Parcubacteria bacterium]